MRLRGTKRLFNLLGFSFLMLLVCSGIFLIGRSNPAGSASVSILNYTNINGAKQVTFVLSNGHPWPVDFLAGMPELKTATGWHDLWAIRFDYRLMLEVDSHATKVFTQPVPTNMEPTRIRFLSYRADSGLRGVQQKIRDLLGLDVLDDGPINIYSEELMK